MVVKRFIIFLTLLLSHFFMKLGYLFEIILKHLFVMNKV